MKKKFKIKLAKPEEIPAILKIKDLFLKQGYLPSRKNQSYEVVSPNTQKPYGLGINCFGHACLNLTNEQLDSLNLSEQDAHIFDIKEYSYEPDEYIEKNFIKRMERFGLTAKHCKKSYVPQNENEWKVALYFGYINFFDTDYHFLKQEKDGRWSGKIGWKPRDVEQFDKLPKVYISPLGTRYYLYKTFIISNPEALVQSENNHEML